MAIVAILVVTIVSIFAFANWRNLREAHGSYALNPIQLRILSFVAARGDCDAAYLVGRHHLFASLDYKGAAKYFRIAAGCPEPNANAIAGLITVLRRPEEDAEVDSLVRGLKKINPEYGADAQTEVEHMRQSRNR
jgi:hypothetical protein